jgi:hypothetical protein
MDTFSGDCGGTSECGQPVCSDSSSWVFARVRVRPMISQGAVVEWLLNPRFADPAPHIFELQWGQTDISTADDWTNVGLPANDVYSLTDSTQRAWGHTLRQYYRVKLSTPLGEYVSRPVNCLGWLGMYEWRILVNRERIWKKQFIRTIVGEPGWLLKRKIHGQRPTPASKILDYQTNEIIDAQATETMGTEFVGGYYDPVCCPADVSNFAKQEVNRIGRGTVNDSSTTKATFLASPMIDSNDIWVSGQNGMRWLIAGKPGQQISHLEEVNEVPIVLTADISLLPFAHISYKLPVGI